jgi:hypothetical protein
MVICPKCQAKGSDICLQELWKNHSIEFIQEKDGRLMGGCQNEGSPYKVVGICTHCDHIWTLRGIAQITDLGGYV